MAGKKNKQELNEFLERVVTKITEAMDVDEILLFGSYAKGEENDCSDIDIAVVSSELDPKKSMYANAMKIFDKVDLYEPYLQLVPFASQKFYSDDFHDQGFLKAVKKTGTKIYSKAA